MTEEKPKRRLSAILAADVVGYSRLMEGDETGTLRALSRLIDEVIAPLIANHHGRVVKLMGDGLLAEFGSVVDAVSCADAWQSLMTADFAADPIRFRIGVNQGDIIIQDSDIFGEGVNIAARLEGDASLSYGAAQQLAATKLYTQNQLPANNLFNPYSWAKLIQDWKAGKLARQ